MREGALEGAENWRYIGLKYDLDIFQLLIEYSVFVEHYEKLPLLL